MSASPEKIDVSPDSQDSHEPEGSMRPEQNPASGIFPAVLDETQKQAYATVLRLGGITLSNYQALTGRSKKASKQDLDLMVELGVIQRQGRGKMAVYVPVAEQQGGQRPTAVLQQ